MKTRLLKKVRKRYTIVKIKIEDWMWGEYDKYSHILSRRGNGFSFKLVDSQDQSNWNLDFSTYHSTYKEALDRLIKDIVFDYKHTSKRRNPKPVIEKVWYNKK
jgi:hypothetical protein